MASCQCYRCTREREAASPGETMFGQPVAQWRMFLCETCGNKRCPHSDDHRNACTNSNEPGQKGSRYERVTYPAENGAGSPSEASTSAPATDDLESEAAKATGEQP